MKIIKSIICSIICVSVSALIFCACSSNKEQVTTSTVSSTLQTSSAVSTTVPTTREVKTAKGGNKSEKNAELLKNDIEKAIGVTESGGADVDKNGNFLYQNIRDASFVYSKERNDETENAARKTAEGIADTLQKYYGKMVKSDEVIMPIGSGDNGIDSVLYNFYFKCENGGEVRVQIDSDGVVSYVKSGCVFK